MENMYQEFKDIAEFYIVYISEAHAADDRSPVGYAEEAGINEHTNFGERCSAAQTLVNEKKLTIPCLIDEMDNGVDKSYHALPDRAFLVQKDGRLALAGKRGPWGFPPAVESARQWLEEYRDTGTEPDYTKFQDDTPDRFELQRKMFAAFEAKDYDTALDVTMQMHGLSPKDEGTIYNIACIHALLAHKKRALAWLELAVLAGYDDVDHMLADSDLESLRETDRFTALADRLRGENPEPSGDPEAYAAMVGDWKMKTSMGERSIEATMSLSLKGDRLIGVWKSMGREMPMSDVKVDGHKLSFSRTMGRGGAALEYEGDVDGDKITGKYAGPMGEMTCNGERAGHGGSAGDGGDSR